MSHTPIHLVDSVRVVVVGRERFPSQAEALDSAGRCVTEYVSPAEPAGSVDSPQHPRPTSGAVLMSCPVHESPGEKAKRREQFLSAVLNLDTQSDKTHDTKK